jgi:hypothetical protein
MPEGSIKTKCPLCEGDNELSMEDVFAAIGTGKPQLMTCTQCGNASEITNLESLPTTKNVKFADWVAKVGEEGESWLECIRYQGPDEFLPAGVFIARGDELSPQRLWRYSTANLDKSPSDKSKWWKYDDFVRCNGVDPFIKLLAMRPHTWLDFVTRGRAKDIHYRTRLVIKSDVGCPERQ